MRLGFSWLPVGREGSQMWDLWVTGLTPCSGPVPGPANRAGHSAVDPKHSQSKVHTACGVLPDQPCMLALESAWIRPCWNERTGPFQQGTACSMCLMLAPYVVFSIHSPSTLAHPHCLRHALALGLDVHAALAQRAHCLGAGARPTCGTDGLGYGQHAASQTDPLY